MNNLNRILINAGLKPKKEKLNEGIKASPSRKSDKIVNPEIDSMKGYRELPGLEGPFNFKGRIVYYDPKEGAYWDPTTDFYLDSDETARLHGMKKYNETIESYKNHLKEAGFNYSPQPKPVFGKRKPLDITNNPKYIEAVNYALELLEFNPDLDQASKFAANSFANDLGINSERLSNIIKTELANVNRTDIDRMAKFS